MKNKKLPTSSTNTSPMSPNRNFLRSFKTQATDNKDLIQLDKKTLHSPNPSWFSSNNLSNFDLNTRRLSYENNSTKNEKNEKNQKNFKFFMPNLKESKFLEKIKMTYEKRFHLLNEAEVKKFQTTNSFDNTLFFKRILNENPRKSINFTEINTSKANDRSGFKKSFKLRIFFLS